MVTMPLPAQSLAALKVGPVVGRPEEFESLVMKISSKAGPE